VSSLSNGASIGVASAATGPGETKVEASAAPAAAAPAPRVCPADMASIEGKYCVDKYEGSLVEVLADGSEQPWPANQPVEGHTVRAVSEAGATPQGYISGQQAQEACKRSGKRLCKRAEWKQACKGPEKQAYPYGPTRKAGLCNDQGRAPVSGYSWNKMNDPSINTAPNTLAKSGEFASCTNGYGVYDMVGNIHEWIDDPDGTFLGGYYQDVTQNGDGCNYATEAHNFVYHDYSTGFRCCADVE
jgi:formylglycine-generating enzyme required for sulfatase activity